VGNPEARFDIVAGDKTRAAFKTFNGSLKTSGTNVKRLTAGVLGLVGVGGIGALIKVNADAADSNAKFADKLGISTEKLAGLRYGIGQISEDAGGFEEALTKASKRLGEFNATGGGAGAVWLKKLSLDTRELAQLKPDELFLKYAESIRGLNDRGQQLAAMSALMGDESRKFITVIDEGPDALLAYAAEAEALGIALNRVDTAKIEAANDAIDRSSKVFAGVGTRMAVELAPFFEVASNNFANLAVEHDGFRDQILDGAEAIAIGVGYLGNSWRGWELIWKGLKVGWLDFQSGTMDGLAAMDRGITSVADILPGLDAAPNDDLQKWAISGRVELGAARAELLALASAPMPVDQVKAFFDTVRAESQAAGEDVAAKRKALVESFSGGEEGGDSGGMTAAQEKALGSHRLYLERGVLAEEQSHLALFEREQMAHESKLLMVEEYAVRYGMVESRKQILIANIENRAAKQRVKREKAVESQIFSMKVSAAANAANLIKAIGGESRGAAIAAIAVQKGISIAQIQMSTAAAEIRALAELGPIAGPPAAAKIAFWGRANMGLVAATGLVEAGQASSGGGAGGGFASPNTGGGFGGGFTPAVPDVSGFDSQSQSQNVTQLIFTAPVYGLDDFRDAVTDVMTEATGNEVVIIKPGTRQYNDIVDAAAAEAVNRLNG
jgi:hypothetical protein